MQGWIKLHRKLTEWEWYTDVPTKTLFIHLLLIVNHEPKKWQGKIIDRGEKVTSIGKLATETGLTQKQVRTALDKLIEAKVVGKQTTNQYTLVKVLNYATYQDKDCDEGQTKGEQMASERANEGQTKGNQRATNKNDKNEKNDKKEEITNYHNDDGVVSQLKEIMKEKPISELSPTMQSMLKQFHLI